MFCTDASMLRYNFLENLLILYICILSLLSTDIYVDIAVSYMAITDHQKSWIFRPECVNHLFPLSHIEGNIIREHSALFHRSVGNIFTYMPYLSELLVIVRHYRVYEVREGFY